MHPFDLNQSDLNDLKPYFPEFYPKNLESTRKTLVKGLEISVLKKLLIEKIKITDKQMSSILNKLDHRAHITVTWTELLGFLDSEGERR